MNRQESSLIRPCPGCTPSSREAAPLLLEDSLQRKPLSETIHETPDASLVAPVGCGVVCQETARGQPRWLVRDEARSTHEDLQICVQRGLAPVLRNSVLITSDRSFKRNGDDALDPSVLHDSFWSAQLRQSPLRWPLWTFRLAGPNFPQI